MQSLDHDEFASADTDIALAVEDEHENLDTDELCGLLTRVLPENERVAIGLIYLAERPSTFRQAGEQLGVSKTAVLDRARRAKARLLHPSIGLTSDGLAGEPADRRRAA